jgi:regulator of replication initiation timing
MTDSSQTTPRPTLREAACDGTFAGVLVAEIDALKHDIARHIQIAVDLTQENERLRDGLRAIHALCDAPSGSAAKASRAGRMAYRVLHGFSHE